MDEKRSQGENSRRPKHKRPSASEMDERLSVPLPSDELVEGVLQAGPHPDVKETIDPDKKQKPRTSK